MTIEFSKYADGLVPVIIQDAKTNVVLMLGFMNEEALRVSNETGKVTFYSRSKQRLWTKGEQSGHFLRMVSVQADCDSDTLLIKADPAGPVCHTGADTCFGEANVPDFLLQLETVIRSREEERDDKSYTASLFNSGINKIAQKVGEEAVELVIEAKDNNEERFLNEAADLLFHYLVLLRAKGKGLEDVRRVLEKRHNVKH
jgi:phosphoribosyl-AMP cyclohydrolase / phosphoribosyl-ATP pyrophosphohydrolase